MKYSLFQTTLFFLCFFSLQAANFYVSPKGSDSNPGTKDQPFKTIKKGIDSLKAGDHLFLRGGRYHEEVQFRQLKGTKESPVSISAYPGEEVSIDGTVSISEIAVGKWEIHQQGIYKIKLKQDIWQLIADSQIQTTARWPNAFWHDDSIFDLQHWALGNQEDEWYDFPSRGLNGKYGRMGNTPDKVLGNDIKKLNFDLTGAVAVLNIANFDTYCFPVTSHNRQNGTFTFSLPENHGVFHRPTVSKKNKKLVYRFHKYFFEGKLELLDAPSEWHYDKATKTLYYYPLNKQNPNNMDIRGKVQTYAFDIRDCHFVKISNLNFFGTTLRSLKSQDLTIENCDFLFPSYSKRVLGIPYAADTTTFYQADRLNPKFAGYIFKPSRVTLRNCTFQYADGDGVKLQGTGNVIDNCYFHKIDYSCIDECSNPEIKQRPANGGTVHTWWSPGVIIRRSTIDMAGEAHGFTAGKYKKGHETIIEYCRASRCSRLHSHDGANFHIWQFNCDYVTMRYNWAYDTFKFAFRIDGHYSTKKNATYNKGGLSHHLVAFNTTTPDFLDAVSGRRTVSNSCLCIKGDFNKTYHTTSFDSQAAGLFVRDEGGGGNTNSDTRNNLSSLITRNRRKTETPQLKGIDKANFSTVHRKKSIRDMVRDPDNMDFRPKQGSELIDQGEVIKGINEQYKGKAPDIGAYEYGHTHYWIPGYQAPEASTPIPPHGTKTAKIDCDLMWLEGYRAVSHNVYFGTSKESVQKATTKDPQFKTNLANNIFTPPSLQSGITYYWRIDVIEKDGAVRKGKTWSFTVAD